MRQASVYTSIDHEPICIWREGGLGGGAKQKELDDDTQHQGF